MGIRVAEGGDRLQEPTTPKDSLSLLKSLDALKSLFYKVIQKYLKGSGWQILFLASLEREWSQA